MPVNSRCNVENNRSVPRPWEVVSGVVPTWVVVHQAMRPSLDTKLLMRRLRARRHQHPLHYLARSISRRVV